MLRTHHISPLSLRPLILAGALLLLCLSSCSRVQSICEARTIVAEADSLRNAGQSLSPSAFHLSTSKSDSTTVASAVSALEPVRLIYPTAYAHANYYYGRLLREAGNQPEAMLAFLRVVHSRTPDHAIKGRSYSNIANMCRLAAEHELAYDIYEKAAEEFLLAKDSTNYFYVTNSRAYECAEMGDKEQAFHILKIIEQTCNDPIILDKILETKANACIKIQQNDSAIWYSEQLYLNGNHEPTGLLIRAQAYDNLGNRDSALYYAQVVLSESNYYGDKYNALYILTHNDTTINVEEVLSLTSDRADLQMEYTETRAVFSKATQLLREDLTHKPDLRWLYAILLTLAIVAIALALYIKRKHRKHQLISQQVEDLQQKHDELSEQNLLLESNLSKRQKKMLAEIEAFCKTIQDDSDLKAKLSWNNFDKMCEIVDDRMYGLATKLKERYSMDLNNLRICVLITIGNFTNKEMATILSYDEHTFRTIKNRVAKNLNVSGKNMRDFFLKETIGA